MANTSTKPSDLELQVLSVLWQQGPSTARQVLERSARSQGPGLYHSSLPFCRSWEKKGLLTHTREGVTHVYKPTVTKRQVLQPLLHKLVERIFGGSTSAVFQQLLSETDVTPDELTKIREMLRDHERTHQGK